MPIAKKIAEEMKIGSWIRRMFEQGIRLKKEFGEKNVFDLSLGNPQMEPPKKFTDELKKLVNNPVKGMHHYMPNSGYHSTRMAVANMVNKESKVRLSDADIVMSCGAAGALNVTLKSTLNPGEEVILLSPYFVEYIYYLDNHGLKRKIVETDKDFMPDIAALEEGIGPNTKAIILNSPNNPTGAVYEDKHIRSIAEVLEKKNKEFGNGILLILDDAYGKIVYDGAKTGCIFNHYKNSIIAGSFSKILSIPGERIGYIAVNPECEDHDEIMGAMAFCNRTLGFVNAPAIMQHIIEVSCDISIEISEYQKKRDLLYKGLVEAGYELHMPKGAFYLFPKTPIADDVEFTQILLKEKVLAVPGSGFGRGGYMRLSYCVEDNVIEGAVEGLKKAIKAI